MVNPSGAECAFYYEDFQRGSDRQECRAAKNPRSAVWQPSDCKNCPVPAILAANGSPYLELSIFINPRKLIIGRRVTAEAWCSLHGPIDGDPHVGCPECNAVADDLLRALFDEP
jgi:hypothetical protein